MGKDEGWLICVWMMDGNGKMLYLFYTPSKDQCLFVWLTGPNFHPPLGRCNHHVNHVKVQILILFITHLAVERA